jgi:hypothetical protein
MSRREQAVNDLARWKIGSRDGLLFDRECEARRLFEIAKRIRVMA